MTPAVYTSPIIFSPSMIRALLDGRKTQTRRLITSQWANVKMHHEMGERCLLWARETVHLERRKDNPDYRHAEYQADDIILGCGRWRPSIHMPRWASRLTLEVTDARVQRLQDISREDAQAEGITQCESGFWWFDPAKQEGCYHDPRWAYEELWESLHGSGSWKANPEIVAFTFKVHLQNVNALIGQGGAA